MARLQPLVFGLAEELLSVSLELNAVRLQQVLDCLSLQVRREQERTAGRFLQHALDAASGFVSFSIRRSCSFTRSKMNW